MDNGIAKKIYDNNFLKLKWFFNKNNISIVDSEELTHVTLTKAILNFDKKNLNNINDKEFINWLYKIAKNTLIDHYRYNNNKNLVLVDEMNDNICDDYVDHGLNRIMKETLENNEYELMSSYYFDGYTLEEVSKMYKINKNTIKQKLTTLRNKIKDKIID